MFEDIIGKPINNQPETKSVPHDDVWNTGQAETWTVFDTPSKDLIWTADSQSVVS